MKCYLAGPMRSRPDNNNAAFMAGATALRAAGWIVFNPAEMDSEEAMELGRMTEGDALREIMRRDLRVLTDELKAENGDAIVLLPGWEESTGAVAERGVAIWATLRILELDEALCQHQPWCHAGESSPAGPEWECRCDDNPED